MLLWNETNGSELFNAKLCEIKEISLYIQSIFIFLIQERLMLAELPPYRAEKGLLLCQAVAAI